MIIEEKVLRKVLRKLIVEADIDLNVDSGFVVGRKYGSDSSSDLLGGTDFDDEEAGGEISFATSNVSTPKSVIARVTRLGRETGIDPAFIYATEAKESAHNSGAMAWNLHIAINNKYSRDAGVSDITPENIEKMKKATMIFPYKRTKSGGASFYGENAKLAYDAAYKIDPWHAIAGGAWGFYQVLGAYTLPLYNNKPRAWLSAFNSNPSDHSIKAFKKWVSLPEKQGFKEAANSGDYATTTKLYYGRNADKYRNFITKKAAQWKKGLPQKKAMSSSSKSSGKYSSWKGRLGKEKARGINFHKLKDGKNNYRAGINNHTNPTVEFFLELAKPIEDGGYGIKKIITLNGDGLGPTAVKNAKAAGLEVFKNFIHKDNIKSGPGFDKVKSMLRDGNTLIHCTAGADRTGAYVGRYYIDELKWDYDKAKKHTKSFGGEKSGPGFKTTRDFLKNGPRP